MSGNARLGVGLGVGEELWYNLQAAPLQRTRGKTSRILRCEEKTGKTKGLNNPIPTKKRKNVVQKFTNDRVAIIVYSAVFRCAVGPLGGAARDITRLFLGNEIQKNVDVRITVGCYGNVKHDKRVQSCRWSLRSTLTFGLPFFSFSF